jgi:hypothetical protein
MPCKYCNKKEGEILDYVLDELIIGEAETQLNLKLNKEQIEEIRCALLEDEERRLLFLIRDVIEENIYEK